MLRGRARGTSAPRLFKVVIVGETAVGKSSLLLRFADDAFTESYISTIGVDFRFRTFDVDGSAVKLQMWDTAGQERFRTITSAYYRAADGIVIVYDVTNRRSFDQVASWMAELVKHDAARLPVLLVANKSDRRERAVRADEGRALAESLQIPPALFSEVSAKSGDQVESAFRALTTAMLATTTTSTATADSGARALTAGDHTKSNCCA
jgi:Ras-related protein Rab-1A